MKRMKVLVCLLLAASLLLLGGCANGEPLLAETAVPPVMPQKAASVAEAEIGQVVELGRYEQDNSDGNGAEPISWLVIHKEEERALVVSLYGLDNLAYNTKNNQAVTWENCSLRDWLNGDFLNDVFTAEEAATIVEGEIPNPENPGTNVAGGNSTVDRLFVLSIGEINQYMPDTHETATSAYRAVWPTDYAVAQGAFQNYNTGNTYSWLRAPGKLDTMAARVSVDGKIDFIGSSAYNDACVVRPAMWISL